ncbi:MAG: cytochrome c oxidase subunit II [Solirubrobacteraceae bacterium]
MGPESRAQLRQMLVIGGIASALGIALALLIDWFPVPGSTQAGPIDTLWDVLLIASVPIFVLMQTIVLFSAWKFRMRPGDELRDGPPIHGNTKLEIIWTAIPAILLVGLCTYSFVVLQDIEKAEANEMSVRVVGEQFTWTFYYPQEGGEEIASRELILPVNRPVNFTVQSKDVIHDFFVPAFRMKIDAVPGIDTRLRVTPNREGEYPVICAELCGLGHSTMRQTAVVVPQQEFESRLAELREGAADGGGEEQAQSTDGEELFTTAAQPAACGTCHTLSAAGTTGTTGPNLDDALADLDEEQIRTAITDPEAEIAEGFSPGLMPNFGETLSDEQVDALVEYLTEVSG